MKDTRCHVRRSIQLRSGEASEASTFRAVVAESSSPAHASPHADTDRIDLPEPDALLATVIRYLFANDEAEAVRHLVSSSVSCNVYKGVDIFGQTDRAVFDVVLEGGPALLDWWAQLREDDVEGDLAGVPGQSLKSKIANAFESALPTRAPFKFLDVRLSVMDVNKNEEIGRTQWTP